VREFYLQSTYDLAASFHEEGRTAEAVMLYQKLIETGPSTRYHELSAHRLAEHYYVKREYTRSLAYIQMVLDNEVSIHDENAQLLKGYIAYDRKQYVQALHIFDRFIESYPRSERVETAREWKSMCERVIRYFG
jgi:TolA-binding protein